MSRDKKVKLLNVYKNALIEIKIKQINNMISNEVENKIPTIKINPQKVLVKSLYRKQNGDIR